MSLGSMEWELAGSIPGLSKPLARTYINRAWRTVRDSNLWSFQLGETGIFTPGLIGGTVNDNQGNSAGTVTVTQGSTTVVGDATAATAWEAQTFPLLTSFQFREQGRSIYNVIAYNGTNQITLDRPFLEPTGTGQLYQMYQCYYPTPVKDFKRSLSVRDMYNGYWLDIWMPRREIDAIDPLRLYFSNPTVITGYETDQRPGSATLGWMLYEMYPSPTGQLTYMWYYVRTGLDLVNPSDTLPYPMTEECVLHKAKVYAYEWAEARRDILAAKGTTGNYLALQKAAEAEYQQRCKEIRLVDRDAVDSYLKRLDVSRIPQMDSYYNTTTNRGYGGW